MGAGETQTEHWRYAGRRLSNGKIRHAWDPDGTDLVYFKSIAGGVIGAVYQVEVSRDSDDGLTLHGKPHFVASPDGDVDEVVLGWRAQDAAARHELERAREEKRAAADGDLEAALDVLRAHFAACRNYSAKWSFAQWVAAEVARPVRGRG